MKTYKSRIIVAAVLLAAAWCLWYSRPVNFRVLTGIQEPDCIDILVVRFEDDDGPHSSFRLQPGDPDMETVLQELEVLRFRRNPLDVIQKLGAKIGLLNGGPGGVFDSELDYDVWMSLWEGESRGILRNWGDNWRYRCESSYNIPVSVTDGLERGRELGAFLFAMRLMRESSQAG